MAPSLDENQKLIPSQVLECCLSSSKRSCIYGMSGQLALVGVFSIVKVSVWAAYLQDMARFECQLKLKEDNTSLLLSHGEKSRDVELESVQSVLHTSEQLRRVEGAAGIFPSDFCVAIHFVSSGNCIPIFFQSLKEKNIFVIALAKIRTDSNKAAELKGNSKS